jgi:multiple sugar transport system permease protein
MFPLYWVFTISLKTPSDIFTWPPKFIFTPTLSNYITLFSGEGTIDIIGSFINTFIIVSMAIIVSLLVGVPAAYSLARFKFKGNKDLSFMFLSFRFAPALLIALPLFIIFQSLNLLDTYVGMIWVYQLISLPMIIWILRGYIEDIPKEIEYSSQIMGYSWPKTFMKILIPLIKPGIFTAALISFIFVWNNFIFGLVLGSDSIRPITLMAQRYMTAQELRYGEMAAASILAIVPPAVLALFGQKYLIRGLTMGAVKS